MIKVGDWTDIGKIKDILEVPYTKDNLRVIRGESKEGDTFKLWISERGTQSPFEPSLWTEKQYLEEYDKEVKSTLSFYKGR